MRWVVLVVLACWPAVAVADCDTPQPWAFETTDANGKNYELETSFPDRVTVIFYEGQGQLHVNDGFKEAMQADEKIGDSGSLLGFVDYIGIANYRDIRAPDWIVRKFLKKRIKKFRVPVLDDRDACFSGTGTSKKCKDGERREYFHPDDSNFVVLYDRVPVLHVTGTFDTELVPHVRSIVEAAADDKTLCWVVENLRYGGD